MLLLISGLLAIVFLYGCGGDEGARSQSGTPRGSTDRSADDRVGAVKIPQRPPATEAAEKVLETLDLIERGMTSTRYTYRPVIDERGGIFHWDCSSMAAWVLGRAAPEARSAVGGRRPLARDFYRLIISSPTAEQRHGWRRLEHIRNLSPGDLFAWLRPVAWDRRDITGHVGFVTSTPQRHPDHRFVWLLDIADASRVPHNRDSRPSGGPGGFGTGAIAIQTNAEGQPIAFGWNGVHDVPDRLEPTKITFGRVTR